MGTEIKINLLYKPEYKVTPYFAGEKIRKKGSYVEYVIKF
jgi:hypothetical protein